MIKKPRVGIVGEILVKFLPAANNHLVELLEAEGAEAVVPDLLDFLLYCFYNQNFKADNLGMKKSKATSGNARYQSSGMVPCTGCQKHLQKANTLIRLLTSEDLAEYGTEHCIPRKPDR